MKLIVNIPGIKDWVSRVNEELPPEIRVWGKVSTLSRVSSPPVTSANQVRVQGGFNARLYDFLLLGLSARRIY